MNVSSPEVFFFLIFTKYFISNLFYPHYGMGFKTLSDFFFAISINLGKNKKNPFHPIFSPFRIFGTLSLFQIMSQICMDPTVGGVVGKDRSQVDQ